MNLPEGAAKGGDLSAGRLSESHLGEKVSILFRIPGDPEHPFSEVIGLVQQIDRSGSAPVYRIVRRSGEVVSVPETDVVKVKVIPAAGGPVRAPKTWSGR